MPENFQIGDYVEVVAPRLALGRYDVGSRGFITGKWTRMHLSMDSSDMFVEQQWNYWVDFDNGRSATVLPDEIVIYEAQPESTDSYLIIAPLGAYYISACGEVAGEWFDHSTGRFLKEDQVLQIVNEYRTLGVAVL